MAWLFFMGWIISQAEWEDYSNYFGEGAGISRNWATAHFLNFYGWPQNCHGTGGCVIQQMLMYYNERIMRLKVYWKSNLPPSWTQLVLTSFRHVPWLYHSFKGCALPPSLLFHLNFTDEEMPAKTLGEIGNKFRGTCITDKMYMFFHTPQFLIQTRFLSYTDGN